MSKYKCKKHKTNHGFIDEEGNWHCIFCYREDKYRNINGILLKEIKVKNRIVRIVDRSRREHKSVFVEVFNFKTKKLLHDFVSRDLSVCLREFENIVRMIQEGKENYNRNRDEPELILEDRIRRNLIRVDTEESNEEPEYQETGSSYVDASWYSTSYYSSENTES